MTVSSRRIGGNTGNCSTLYGGLALALGLGVAAATGHGVSWADTTGGDSAGSSVSHSGSATGTGASPGAQQLASERHRLRLDELRFCGGCSRYPSGRPVVVDE